MLGIILYCIGVMYTPGPVNILSLNVGLQKKAAAHAPFCLGVATALCLGFLLVGYAGSAVVSGGALPLVAGAGTCFIVYLAYKIATSDVDPEANSTGAPLLRFKDGLLIQLLNPKSLLAVLPVTTVQFPAADITGAQIALWSVGLSALAFGAPFSYALFGATLSRRVTSAALFKRLNALMALLLLAVAADMAYQHVYLALR